jgi:hypothetical protein
MNRIVFLIARLFGRDRRHHDDPAHNARRRARDHGGVRGSQDRVLQAVEDLERTVRLRQDDIENGGHQRTTNDMQQVVIFHTLQDACRFRGPDALKVRLCRHERHQDAANTALAICEEGKCPIILEAIRGGAAA